MRPPAGRGQAGFLTAEATVAAALSLLLFTLLANLILGQYVRATVRSILDEAVRDAARSSPELAVAVARCEERAAEGRRGLLGGGIGDGIVVTCDGDAGTIGATADVVVGAWLPAVPDWRFTARARADREVAP